jgi:long-chain acyl-CoA synthetase
MLTHRNLVSNSASVAEALQITRDDRLLVVLPLFHAFAATVGMLTPLLHGCALVPVPRFDPKLVSQAIAAQGATLFLGVPSMYAVLLRLDEASLAQWASVRLCVSGGAALPAAVLAAFEGRFGVPILEGDGPTECSPVTCVNPPVGVRKPGSVGLPVPGVEMRILDAGGRELADGTPGEVCVRGPNVMLGYFGLPDATREAFFGDWFRTGDLGTRDADGYFYAGVALRRNRSSSSLSRSTSGRGTPRSRTTSAALPRSARNVRGSRRFIPRRAGSGSRSSRTPKASRSTSSSTRTSWRGQTSGLTAI